jgi:hypothetical protein
VFCGTQGWIEWRGIMVWERKRAYHCCLRSCKRLIEIDFVCSVTEIGVRE